MASAYHLELEAFPHFSRFASLNEMQEYLQKVLKQMEAAVQTATNKYAHILSIAKQYVQKWMPIVAASQTVKGNEKEREFLYSWIDVVDYE